MQVLLLLLLPAELGVWGCIWCLWGVTAHVL